MASPAEAAMATAHGADAVGLVGEMPSGPGTIDDGLAREISLATLPPVTPFLLTSRVSAEGIAEHARDCAVATVQIVSHVAPSVHETLREMAPELRRVQVVHVEDGSALDWVREYDPYVDVFLLDSGRPNAPVAELGGTGRVHDWDVSAEIVRATDKPVFLAGGLRPDNVADAVRQVQPFGIDVCSGVRTDGRLDAQKLGEFVAAIAAV